MMPLALAAAYTKASTVWGGTDVIAGYRAMIDKLLPSPPALITRGQYDFVSTTNMYKWRDCFEHVAFMELEGCSHHGLLEQLKLYAQVLQDFWQLHENNDGDEDKQ
jgi:pimeloyl-ACP methyl ester carboxylesterase